MHTEVLGETLGVVFPSVWVLNDSFRYTAAQWQILTTHLPGALVSLSMIGSVSAQLVLGHDKVERGKSDCYC